MTSDNTAYVPAPTRRIAVHEVAPEFYRAMIKLEQAAAAGLERSLSTPSRPGARRRGPPPVSGPPRGHGGR